MVLFQPDDIDLTDFAKFIKEFADETDRAAAVLGAANLESILEKLLISYFLPFESEREKNEFFSSNGPLGTFSSRIRMVYRLKIIDADFYKALLLIKKIRNEFAHNISSLKLDRPPMSDQVKELTNPLMNFEVIRSFRDSFFKGINDSSANFRTALSLILFMLDYLSRNVTDFHSGNPFPLMEIIEYTNGQINEK